jgi:hypothetical protein
MRSAGTPAGRVPVDARFIYSDHKQVHTPAIAQRQRALLQKAAYICDFLEPRERVLLVAPCVSAHVSRALLIVTNKGMFHVPTRLDLGFRHSIARFRYADCRRLAIYPWGLRVEYGNGRKEHFFGFARQDRLKLKVHLNEVRVGGAEATGGKTALCPRCARALVPPASLCPSCRLPFKDAAAALRAALVIPGGGYFYVGRPVLGTAEAIGGMTLSGLFVVSLGGSWDTGFVSLLHGQLALTGGALFWGAALAVEKLLTWQHVKRYLADFIPKPKTLQPHEIVPA